MISSLERKYIQSEVCNTWQLILKAPLCPRNWSLTLKYSLWWLSFECHISSLKVCLFASSFERIEVVHFKTSIIKYFFSAEITAVSIFRWMFTSMRGKLKCWWRQLNITHFSQFCYCEIFLDNWLFLFCTAIKSHYL